MLKSCVPRLSGKEFQLNRKVWPRAVRVAYLPASLIPVLAGLDITWRIRAAVDWELFGLTLLGVALAHISADLFNEYFDYKHGTDQLARERGLSGGSGLITEAGASPANVLRGASVTMGLAVGFGLYLALERGALVLVLMAFGAASIFLYTSVLQRLGFGEATLAVERVATVLGTVYVQTLSLNWIAFYAGAVLGLLSIYTVYYAAFPDYQADLPTGKRTIVVSLGPRRAARLLFLVPLSCYAILIATVMVGILPEAELLCLLFIPLFIFSIWELRGDKPEQNNLRRGLRVTSIAARGFGLLLAIALI